MYQFLVILFFNTGEGPDIMIDCHQDFPVKRYLSQGVKTGMDTLMTSFTGMNNSGHVIYLVIVQEYIIEQDGNYDPEKIDYQRLMININTTL